MTDVVVVGASVAGFAAAIQAANDGAEVLLLDRRSGPAEDVPPAAVAFDALWPPSREFSAAEIARYEQAIVRAGKMHANVRAGSRLFDRAKLDGIMAGMATRAGAEVVWSARDLVVETNRTVRWRGGSAEPKVLILADGADGNARKFLPSLRDPDEMRIGQAWRLEETPSALLSLDIAFSPRLPGGRVQLNPMKQGVVVWAFHHDRPPSRKDVVAAHPLLDSTAPDALIALGPPRPDSVFTLPGRISAERLLVVGGAAGQGGLELGHHAGTHAGHVAAQAVREDRATAGFLHEHYEAAWKEQWQGGLERFRDAFNKFTAMSVDEQERILEPWHRRELDLHDVTIPIREPGVGRTWAALKASLRNARRMLALLHTYRQLKAD